MITIRWWILMTVIPLLVGTGVATGYLLEKTVRSMSASETVPSEDIDLNLGSPHVAPSGEVSRDPAMVAGASFMAKVTEYRQRLDRNPDDLGALIFLGNANYDITRFEQAGEYYRRALQLDPANIHVRTDFATTLFNQGRKEEALREIRNVLDRNPDHETALLNLGLILLDTKNDRKGAIQAWDHLLKKHPDSPLAGSVREKLEQLKRHS